jgi:hypothetical protein
MKRNLLISFICLGSLYISFKVGYEYGIRQSTDEASKRLMRGFLLTTAYGASLSLTTEMGNHQFLEDGHYAVATQFSVDRMNILIDQIEGIDYSDTPFEAEINTNLSAAKTYLENLPDKE